MVRFEAQIDHVRSDAINGVVLSEPESIRLSQDTKILDESGVAMSLANLKTRQLDAGQQLWVRVTFESDGAARRVEILGIDPVFPENLGDNEVTVLIRDINTDDNSIQPDAYPFIEIATPTLESPGTYIFDADERRISLSELQSGAIVQVLGHFYGAAFTATEIRVLHEIIHTNFGGIVLEVRSSNEQTELVFTADHPEWLEWDVEVLFDDDFVGTGVEAVRAILNESAGPLSVQLMDHSQHSGNFRRARFFEGVTLGKRWEEVVNSPVAAVTMQVRTGADGIYDEQDERFGLKPAQTVFVVPSQARISENDYGQMTERSIYDLEPFMEVYVNIQLAGERVINADININKRPVYETFDLRVEHFDRANNRLNFDTGGSIRLLRSARLLDVVGNPLPGLSFFQDLQYEHQAVALVTIDPATGRGLEARLVPVEELGPVGDDQIVIGSIKGLHLGFWTYAEEGELGTNGLNGILLDNTVLVDLTGQPVSAALLERGVGVTVTGALVSSNMFIQNIKLQAEATAWSFTTRIEDFDPHGNWIRFEESDPLRIDREAEVFDHFGGPASLRFIQELFDRGDLQLRLTFGESSEDRSRVVIRVEAFRHDETIDEGTDQEIVTSGRLEPWSNPPLLYPQEISDVRFGPETEFIGLNGELIQARDIERGVRILASGLSIVKETTDGNQFSSRTHNAVMRIEILGGAATQYRGFVADVSGSSISFKTPEPLFVSPHTDIQEETGFRIDIFTLASRLENAGGLRMWLSGDFGGSGEDEIWWGRIMRPDEPNPKFLHDNETIAFVIGVDAENSTLIRAPIPQIEITSETEVRSKTGQAIALTDIVADALVTIVTEDRGGSAVAVEIVVDRIPKPFSFTVPVGYVDADQRFLEFLVAPFMSLSADAEIVDSDGSILDLPGLQTRLFETRGLLRVSVTPDSPTEAPIISRIEVIENAIDESGELNIYIDEPQYRIRVYDRTIEPTPFPMVSVAPDAQIIGADGSPIDLHDLREGMRIHVTGQNSEGRLLVTEIRVVGGSVFVEEAVIAQIDVENRLLYPEPEPAQHIDQRAHISNQHGFPITLAAMATIILETDEDLVLVVEFNQYAEGIVSLGLFNPEFGQPQGHNIGLWDVNEIEINLATRMLEFRKQEPARLADDAIILGPQGNPLGIEDLVPGLRAFVRGEEIGENVIITAITVIPEIHESDLILQTGDFDEDGIENDVIINLLDQDGNAIALPLRVFFDFHSPFEARSGYIMTDVPAGPHVVRVEVVSRPEIHDEDRVFISVHGSSLSILETIPIDGATDVATDSTNIRITFNEPIQQFGDFVSVKGYILPKPLSNDVDFSLENEGKVLVLTNLVFAENTSYTLHISSASSRNGSTLTDPLQVRFSTGSALLEFGSLAGSVTLDSDIRYVGSVHLFNQDGERVQETRINESGSFTFNAVFEGVYTIVAEALMEDGLTISGAYDATVDLGSGEVRAGLDILLSLPVGIDTGDTTDNSEATVVLDLDTRTGNQDLRNLKSLPDTEIRVSVYALNVKDVIAFNVSFSYDSTAVSFTGVDDGTDSEINLLKQSGGLAVTLPPVVGASSIDYFGAILGSDASQAVTGDGLLAVFEFKTRNNFSSPAEFLLPRVLIQSRSSRDTLSTLGRATVELAARRILLGLTATPDTIKADGQTLSRLLVDLKYADGDPVMDETAVRFEIVEGSAELSQIEVVTGSSQAEINLFGYASGFATVQVSVDGATAERISVYLEESVPIGSGPKGQIVLDLDKTFGDQLTRVNQSVPSGDEVTVDIVIIEELTAGTQGAEIALLYDSDILSYSGFTAMGVFDGAVAIETTGGDTVTVSIALLGSLATQPSGTVGQAIFQLREEATGDATITILRAQLGGPDGQMPLTLGTGGSTVLLGVGSGPATPDFDGDGEIGFTDFIMFASVFGASSGTENYDARFDLDESGDIGFGDFLIFAKAFGSASKRSTKPVTASASRIHLNLGSTVQDLGDGQVRVTFTLAKGQKAQAYGLTLEYDPEAIEVEDISTTFESAFAGGNEPALSNSDGPGLITFADFGSSGRSGDLVSVTFTTETPTASIGVTGINLVDLSGHITQVPDRSVAITSVPDRLSLGQNYPNPFNPETIIPFGLPESGLARVSIFNLVGQEIAVLVDEHRSAGRHTVRWNGQDDLGRTTSSGIYFVRMVVGSDRIVRKIVLMK